MVVALGSSMCSNFPMSVAIIQWFEKRRARALSMLQFGGAVGGIFVFVTAWSIQTYGWRTTAFASGVIAIVFGWPLARMVKSRPEDIGETVDGLPPAPKDLAPTETEPAQPHVHAARGAAHRRVLADLARPRLLAARRVRLQRARHHAHEGEPGLLARAGLAHHSRS